MMMMMNTILIILTIFCGFSHAQEQNFVIKPVDTNVLLGETAILKCSVTDQHGDVQWLHDGTALGYDRKIPGKPRYKIIYYSNDDTEYHLKIENVTIDDEGVYACQVAPIGDWDTKLEAKAKLSVHVVPQQKPDIYFNDETKNSFDVIHIKQSAIKSSKFACKIRKTKPVAQIKWFLNGTQLASSAGTITETTQKDGQLEDLTSTLEFNEKTQFDNSALKCQVYHVGFNDKELTNMSAVLRLIIVSPPSKPIINGYDEVNGVIALTNMKLTCMSTYTFPPGKLTWFKNSSILTTNYDTVASKTESEYKLKIEPSDNQAIFKCESMNQALDAPLSSEIKLNVLFGPTNVNLEGVFEAKVNETITAVCSSDSANPIPKMRFTFDGIVYEPTSQTITAAESNGYAINASYTHTVSREHNGKELKCIVENQPAKIEKVISKYVKVLFPPESIDITYTERNRAVVEGTKVKLTCTSQGGNPPADIEWLMNGLKLKPLYTRTLVYTTESTIEIELKRENHGQSVECIASNKVGTLKQSVALNVSYLPLNVRLTLIEPTSVSAIKAGSSVVVACIASNSNPSSQIAWYKDNFLITPQQDQQDTNTTEKLTIDYETTSYLQFIASSSDHNKEVRCDVQIKDIQRTMHASLTLNVAFKPEIIKPPQSVIDINENGTFSLNLTARANPPATYSCSANNGKTYTVENAVLQFTASRLDNAEFKCLLTNSESASEVNFRLNVKYGPTATANGTQYISNKGDLLNLYCNVYGNPLELSHVTWKFNGKQLPSDGRFISQLQKPNLAILTVNTVRDVDDGNFTCSVANSIGSTAQSANIRVLVRRPPVIQPTSVLKAAEDSNEARSAKFECKAQAYPDVTFKWKLGSNVDVANSSKYIILNTKIDQQIFKSTLIIQTVVSSDYGTYLCEVKNDIGAPVIAKALLNGKHQPEKPSEFKIVNITRNTIHLEWKKNFDGGDAQRFRIRYRKDTMDPTYKYVETDGDQTSVILDNLEMATRYVINIQSLNKYGTEGYLQDPLIVQTDFGFNDVNQLPIYNPNDLPLTIILIVCGVGTLLLLFNVILIVYFIRKRKRKDETSSTTGTNETDANTVEMFTPLPPYPDELNYHYDISPHLYDDENRPFVSQPIKNPKCSLLNSNHDDYTVEYATPVQSITDQNGNSNQNLNEHHRRREDTYMLSSNDMRTREERLVHAFPYNNRQKIKVLKVDLSPNTIANSALNGIYQTNISKIYHNNSDHYHEQQQRNHEGHLV